MSEGNNKTKTKGKGLLITIIVLISLVLVGLIVAFIWSFCAANQYRDIQSNISEMQNKITALENNAGNITSKSEYKEIIEYLEAENTKHREFIETQRQFIIGFMATVGAVGMALLGIIGFKTRKEIEDVVSDDIKKSVRQELDSDELKKKAQQEVGDFVSEKVNNVVGEKVEKITDEKLESIVKDTTDKYYQDAVEKKIGEILNRPEYSGDIDEKFKYLRAAVNKQQEISKKKITFFFHEDSINKNDLEQCYIIMQKKYGNNIRKEIISKGEENKGNDTEKILNILYDNDILVYGVKNEEFIENSQGDTDKMDFEYKKIYDICNNKKIYCVLYTGEKNLPKRANGNYIAMANTILSLLQYLNTMLNS